MDSHVNMHRSILTCTCTLYMYTVSTRECGGGGAPVISVNHLYQLSSLGAWCSTHVQYLHTKHI